MDESKNTTVQPALSRSSSYTLMSYSVSPDGLKNHIKSPILWGNFIKDDRSAVCLPLAYLRKPKWMSDEDWGKVVSGVNLHMPHEAKSFTV